MTDTTNTQVAEAAKNYSEAEKAGKVEMVTGGTATIAEAFKVQIDALRGEATSWRDAAEKSKKELAEAQSRIAELEQTAATARRSLAEAEVRQALNFPARPAADPRRAGGARRRHLRRREAPRGDRQGQGSARQGDRHRDPGGPRRARQGQRRAPRHDPHVTHVEHRPPRHAPAGVDDDASDGQCEWAR